MKLKMPIPNVSGLSWSGFGGFGSVMTLLLALFADQGALADVKPIVPVRTDQHEACKDSDLPILIQVEGVESDQGFITGQLHDNNPENWLVGKKRLDRERWIAEAGATEICFVAPEPGTYALAVYHDLNANRKLDITFPGVPSEPWGLSNNPRPRFGIPSHDEVAFVVPEGGVTLTVRINDPNAIDATEPFPSSRKHR